MAKTELDQDLGALDAPDLSEAEYAEHHAGSIARVVEMTGLATVVETQHAVGQIHLLCRVKPDNEKAWVHSVGHPLLLALRGLAEVFFGKEYFLKNDNMRYGWVMSFSSRNLKEVASRIGEALDEAIPKTEVKEAPLVGPRAPVGSISGGKKGASAIR